MFTDKVSPESAKILKDAGFPQSNEEGIPSHGDVIDWLFTKHNIVINFEPVFTFALKDHVAYYVTAYKVDNDNAIFIPVFENEMEMYSFGLAMKEIIEKLKSDGII